ncbi:MAG: acylneuraminate cytidylyltransferase family protein [Gammaproteobacteria bacterium]|nr:acylneuraminate cytidylyltransferase family protein [Gammaproteobacteria bacterium]MCF6363665.1 acylneuraminate cytidylyltransferase family protein [Gammaproteobacteria bacterium]
MNPRELLVVIPARGGSKGLPGKNIRPLDGLPLLGWTAEALRHSGLREARCLLSTDDMAIAEAGRACGLEAPFLRPAALAGDTISSVDVVLHTLDWLAEAHDEHPSWVLLLQPTSPFRPPAVIDQAWDMLHADPTLDAVIGVKAIQRSPGSLFLTNTQGRLCPLGDDSITRRQDSPGLLTPNGALYLIRSSVLCAGGNFFPPASAPLPMDAIASLDIDDASDWAIAEALLDLSWRAKT